MIDNYYKTKESVEEYNEFEDGDSLLLIGKKNDK